ncbi:MAG TPA: hypothetical protein LFW21_03330 [Rickettsia endosymbiont of Pyrocoelia pectoralis]|nr:hypothetical protein [Rickettsia endosymbiont of Pyrocoelia pectoralis]
MPEKDQDQVVRDYINKWNEHDRKVREREKHGNSSDGDGEFLVAIVIIGGYVCYKAVEGAVTVTTTGSKIIGNAYKIKTGKIEVLGTDPETKTTYIARSPSPRSATTTTQSTTTEPLDSSDQTSPRPITSKREKVKVFSKKLLDGAKTSATTLSTAYKLTTGKVEVVDRGSDMTRDGKEKFIFSEPTKRNITTKEFKLENGYKCGIVWEETINTSLKVRLNNKLVYHIENFRSVIVPDNTQDTGGTFDLSLILKEPNGDNMSKDDPTFLKIHYDRDGTLKEISLPNTPIIFQNQWYPALSVYKGKIYSLPISSGYYRYLNEVIHKNHGEIKIDHVDREFSVELLGE